MKQSIRIPGAVYFGQGSISAVREIIESEQAEEVLIVTDKGVIHAGIMEKLLDQLRQCNVKWNILDGITPEPSYHAIEELLQEMGQVSCNLIIAIGGGSVMDTAKLCSVLGNTTYGVLDLLEHTDLARKKVKTVMIPTTCGTGAEATFNAIVAIPEENVKKGIVSPAMMSDYVILDVDMIISLPPQIIAATGVDALAHAVECYTSNKATALSNLYAAESARLIFRNILTAYNQPDAIAEKEKLLLGAYYGGIAIAGSGTTAVHALSYPLGGKYHIPHGVSNAILLGHVMRVNKSACETELATLYKYIWPDEKSGSTAQSSERLIEAIEKIIVDTSIPTNLKAYGVEPGDIGFLVAAGSGQRRLLDNNKKDLSNDDIRNIYLKVL